MSKKSMLSSTGRVFQNVSFGSEALGDMQRGAEILYKAVKSTMGPSGHNVIIENGMSAPLITKDGVTVAKSINLREKLPSIGAELLKEIAAKTNELSGDGPQPLYSKVLTPTGFITMGEIKEGMEICGTNGSIQTVLGVYPKGKKEICKIYFTDGNTETRTVECSEDHLWAVKTYYGHAQILTTKQMLESGLRRKTMGGKYFIQPTEAQYADNSDQLPLDPYLLGVLLGDGSLSQNYGIEIAVGLNQSYILNGITLPANCTLRCRIGGFANPKCSATRWTTFSAFTPSPVASRLPVSNPVSPCRSSRRTTTPRLVNSPKNWGSAGLEQRRWFSKCMRRTSPRHASR
jgi:hypothetical protein